MNNTEDAYKIALEWLKHLITLSSSIVVFSGTLVGTVLSTPNWSLWFLGASWIMFILVILLSLETISTITYSRINQDNTWTKGKGLYMALASKWFFVAGIVTFVIFAVANVTVLLK